MFEAFNHAVPCAAYRDQIVSHVINGLVMGGIYLGTLAVELIEEILTAQAAVVDVVELITADPFMIVCGDDILVQIAAEMNIDQLETFADAEHWLASCDEAGECLEL